MAKNDPTSADGSDDDGNPRTAADLAVANVTTADAADPTPVGVCRGTSDDDEANTEIGKDWAEDYPPGTELFCARFEADDFDSHWGTNEYPEGATVAIQRGSGMPPQGWIIRHAHLSDLERTKAILEKHASADALAILYDLNDKAFDEFADAWGEDGGMKPGKSNRSARRSANTKRR